MNEKTLNRLFDEARSLFDKAEDAERATALFQECIDRYPDSIESRYAREYISLIKGGEYAKKKLEEKKFKEKDFWAPRNDEVDLLYELFKWLNKSFFKMKKKHAKIVYFLITAVISIAVYLVNSGTSEKQEISSQPFIVYKVNDMTASYDCTGTGSRQCFLTVASKEIDIDVSIKDPGEVRVLACMAKRVEYHPGRTTQLRVKLNPGMNLIHCVYTGSSNSITIEAKRTVQIKSGKKQRKANSWGISRYDIQEILYNTRESDENLLAEEKVKKFRRYYTDKYIDDLELIVISDESRDNYALMVPLMEEKDTWLQILHNELKNIGKTGPGLLKYGQNIHVKKARMKFISGALWLHDVHLK